MKTDPSAIDQALVERTLSEGFRLLRFPASLEIAFVQAHADARTLKLILAGISAVFIYAGLLLADYLMTPQLMLLAVALRVGLFGSFALFTLWFFHRLSFPQLNEWMVVPVVLLAACISAILATRGVTALGYTKIVEYIIIVTFVAVFARFWPMVMLSVLMLGVHFLALYAVPDVVGTVRLGSTLLLLTTVMFALYACYTREHNDRMAFLNEWHEQALRASLNDANVRLDDMARTDALTGVANRRAFDETLALHARSETARQLGLLLIDVDHFKAFNDRYGHQAGDRCLCTVADTIALCLRRPVDMLARWGGEEFVVLLADADAGTTRHVAERICQAVEAAQMPHAASSCASVVTVSVGMAIMSSKALSDTGHFLQLADDALYRAKADGRNRVVMSAPMLAGLAA